MGRPLSRRSNITTSDPDPSTLPSEAEARHNSPKLQGPSAVTLKPSTLAERKHQLKIICQRKHPESTNTLIGLDYVVLKTPGKLTPAQLKGELKENP